MNDRVLPLDAASRRTGTAAAHRNGRRPASAPAVQVAHAAVPGRLRLVVAGLKRDAGQASYLESVAEAWLEVRRASASPLTGSLLLEFDPRQIDADALVLRVQEVVDGEAVGPQAHGRPNSRPAREVSQAFDLAASPAFSGPPARAAGSQHASISAEVVAELEEAPVAPPSTPRARELEAALGVAALIGTGVMLLAVREHGHKLALDQVPLAVAQEIHSPQLTALMRGASHLAEPAVLWPVTLGATVLGAGRRQRGDFPWLAPMAVGGGATLISLLKLLLRRARPAAFEHLTSSWGYSLPSGHAFLAATLYGLLAHHGARWLRARRPDDRYGAAVLLTLSTAAVLLVGISRVYLGVHYPTDVIAGYALALLWLFFLAAINDRPRPAAAA